jgi:alkaline phosphatase
MVTDFLAFDDAVKVAVDFARMDGHTQVVVFPDHNTGALSLGQGRFGYTDVSIEALIDPLKGMQVTSTELAALIGSDLSAANVKAVINSWWGIDVADEHIQEILDLEPALGISYAISEVVSDYYTYFGWTTHGHTGEDVPLWSFGPHRPAGFFDNTDLAKHQASMMGFDLEALNRRLFIDAERVFSNANLDTADAENPVLRVGPNAELPISKNILRMNGNEYELEGLVVYTPATNKVYIPMQAVNWITGWGTPEDIRTVTPPPGLPAGVSATYNVLTNTLHIPYFDNGMGQNYWIDMQMQSTNPTRFEVTEFGENQ